MTTTPQAFRDLVEYYNSHRGEYTASPAAAALVDWLHLLNDDELDVLGQVFDGLVAGREVYGPLDTDSDPRDFTAAAAEELRDAITYQAIEVQRRRRREAPPFPGGPTDGAAK
jgi:hypothetical protein